MIESLFPLGWQHYLIGGLWIGAAVGVLFLLTGLVSGMSTVFSSTWSYVSKLEFFRQPRFVGSRAWRLVLAAGLILGAALCAVLVPNTVTVTSVPPWQLLLGGALVGYGARLSNGCTSGHGICGLASLQLPSLLAVLTFLATAFATANLTWWALGR